MRGAQILEAGTTLVLDVRTELGTALRGARLVVPDTSIRLVLSIQTKAQSIELKLAVVAEVIRHCIGHLRISCIDSESKS